MSSRKKFCSLVFLCLCLMVTDAAFAQVNATVGGSVTDPSGAVIPGVSVTAKNVNTGVTATRITNETGSYDFPSLQPGVYSVSAMLPGFRASTYSDVRLSQGQQVRLNFKLELEGVAQSVEVSVAADTILAQTASSVGNVLGDQEVRSLPLASRNVLDLSRFRRRVVGNNFGGARMSQINTTRDGLPTGDGRYLDWNGAYSATFTSPDLVEEVQVNVNTVDAARGSRLRPGAHADAFGHQRSSTARSSTRITTRRSASQTTGFRIWSGRKKTTPNRNQFGGRLGGPIMNNKAFFFFLYDGQRFLEKQRRHRERADAEQPGRASSAT